MLAIKIRQAIVYGATGIFFCVAAMGQLQGAAGMEVFIKAGVACLTVICLGVIFLYIVGDAADRASAPMRATTHGQAPRVAAAPAQADHRAKE